MTEPKRPPNRARATPPEAKFERPERPPRPNPPPLTAVLAAAKVEITVGEVKITIEGPLLKVMAVLDALFGTSEPSSVISRLQLVFGSETAK